MGTIKGSIDQQNQAKVKAIIKGLRKEIEIEATVDTGFDSGICLPIYLATQLGLELTNITKVELADGSIKQQLVFNAEIKFGDETKDIDITLTDADQTLLGTGLLLNKTLTLDFKNNFIEIK